MILRILFLVSALTLYAARAAGADHTGAQQQYAKLCAACHGEVASGTERGPALVNNRTLRGSSAKQIHDLIRNEHCDDSTDAGTSVNVSAILRTP